MAYNLLIVVILNLDILYTQQYFLAVLYISLCDSNLKNDEPQLTTKKEKASNPHQA